MDGVFRQTQKSQNICFYLRGLRVLLFKFLSEFLSFLKLVEVFLFSGGQGKGDALHFMPILFSESETDQ
jgi:hypothetical protein